MSTKHTEPEICSICQRYIIGYSCNAWPVNKGRCCQECDNRVVTPARIVLDCRARLKESIENKSEQP
jgi:hypothetical protein